jgi:DNA (cytosine-5)-methyltransferase 1
MKYLSLCSGIEAATVAWHPLGWEAVAYSEIERFPSEVLAHHYPNTPNLGDMTKFKEWTNVSNVDVLVGGTPCQSFSVAGLRKGLDDPRGNLMLTYLAIADKYRPKWLVWENVPGVLSSNGGHDFASFLRGLGELGYGFAYRILDAQYFGVAQRRRRVFVVGYLGDWQRAAAVLFERDSLCGNPAPSRQKREGVAASTGASPSVGSLCARTGQSISVQDAAQGHLMATWPAEISSTLDTTFGTKQGLENQHVNAGCPMFVPAPLFVTSGQANAAFSLDVGLALNSTHESPYVVQPIASHDVAGTMLSRNTSGGFSNSIDHAAAGYMAIQPIALAENTIGRKPENGGNGDGFTDGGPMYTLNATGVHGVAQPMVLMDQGGSVMNVETDMTGTLRRETHGHEPIVAQPIGIFQDSEYGIAEYDTAGTLRAGRIPAHQMAMQSMAVRRLTPVECERLQGFPDTYTDIKSKGKATPDGPRYKALGNSMAVPVMAWIGKRINEVGELCKPNK